MALTSDALVRRGRGTPAAGPRFSGMSQANIHDRQSIERIYPADAFSRDAAENDRQDAAVLKGVRIASAPDGAGEFALQPAAQHTGEVPGTVFLAAFRRPAERHAAADPESSEGYKAFIDEIIETARRHGYRAALSPGRGDPRIQGQRQ